MPRPAGLPQNPANPQATPPATVVVGKVDKEPSVPTNTIVGNDPLAIIPEFICNNRYESDQHRYMLGITSPGGFQGASVAFVQLAAPTLLWVADWTSSQFNTQPAIPNRESPDPDWVFLYALPETAHLVTGPDGTIPLYRVSGTYVYGHRNPSEEVYKHVVFARPPWLNDNFPAGRRIPMSSLKNNLIDIAGPAGPAGRVR